MDSKDDFPSGCLLPIQYNEAFRTRRCALSEAERNLMFAVLEDAIQILLSGRHAVNRARRVQYLETKLWFEQRDDNGTRGPFGFENLCEALGIDPDRLREHLGLKRASSMAKVFRVPVAASKPARHMA